MDFTVYTLPGLAPNVKEVIGGQERAAMIDGASYEERTQKDLPTVLGTDKGK